MTPQGGPERPSECQKCTPLGPETDSKETPREQSKWVRRAPISHTGKDEQQTDQLGFGSFCWACKPTSTLGLDLTVPLRLSGSRGLGGMREAIAIRMVLYDRLQITLVVSVGFLAQPSIFL